MNYLVTGGAGFIGSHIVEALLARGEQVRVLDNFSTGRRANLDGFTGALDVVPGDITDLPAVQAAMRGVDYVLHQAAVPSVHRSVVDPFTTDRANVLGTLNVLWAAKEAGVKRVAYARGREEKRRPAQQAALALRGKQAGRRAVLRGLHHRLWPRDRGAALL
jgi:nucleoside-diphosphate-sugar epimerase